jgi:hypothetical protein
MVKVVVSQQWLDKCRSFADRCAESNKARYASRGQSSLEKIIKDIYVGKVGECAAYEHKLASDLDCTEPDFNIYGARKKSYAADLLSSGNKLHVKTQSRESAAKYGTSWILQFKPGDSDKLFKEQTPEDIAVLCLMVSDVEVEILAEVRFEWLFQNNLIADPKLKWFIGVKKALYWEDIEAALKEERGAGGSSSVDWKKTTLAF